MSWDARDFRARLVKNTSEFNRAAVRLQVDQLLAQLRSSDNFDESKEMELVLGILRKHRYFDEIAELADALIQRRQGRDKVVRHYGQVLIEQGNFSAALCVLKQLAQNAASDEERSEARGLIGRSHKERFLRSERHTEQARLHLEAAIRAYHDVYLDDKAQLWHGINAVALA